MLTDHKLICTSLQITLWIAFSMQLLAFWKDFYMCLLHKFQDIDDLIVRKPFCKDLLSFILSKLLTEWLHKCRKTLAIIFQINTSANQEGHNQANGPEMEAITFSRCQACKYMCKQVAIAFVFSSSYWLRKWHEFSNQPQRKINKAKAKQTRIL